jgi:hypothetical protein
MFGLVVAGSLSASTAQAAEIVVAQSALTADGNYYTNSIGSNTLGPNDDSSTSQIDLGFDFTFFGKTYSSLYINNNGNVSFDNRVSAYVPTGPTGVNVPIISAWFGDVDTRGTDSGLVHWQFDTANQLVITWDKVGYYDIKSDALASFQMVIRGDAFDTPAGEGTIGFFYQDMPWEVTETSLTSAIGFGDGEGNSVILEGSNTAGLNDVVANTHIWFNGDLAPVPPTPAVPEPATWAMMIGGFALVGASMRRRVTALSFA